MALITVPVDDVLERCEKTLSRLDSEFETSQASEVDERYATYVSSFNTWWDRLWRNKPKKAESQEEKLAVLANCDQRDGETFGSVVAALDEVMDHLNRVLDVEKIQSAARMQQKNGLKDIQLDYSEWARIQ
jgi:hypothetical protein